MPITDIFGTYTAAPAVAYGGMIAEGQIVKDSASKRVTTASVGFGVAVGAGASDGTVRTGGTGFEGITVANKAQVDDFYAIGDMAQVLRK
ncbi:structural cement protein Gp24, partial [Listeria monocytogenes]|uniref:structural cement protein Gp24 n=1 Tax=Listeria monocytogenes TaxID=1639 RepID=UPI003B43A413